jgi:quercetin dioxygenase-like cupin family protein
VTRPVVVPPGAGEVVGDAPDRRVEILCEHAALHATWSRFGPRRDGAPLHVHRSHVDLFAVLDGELTLQLGPDGEPAALGAGAAAYLPRLVVHGFANTTDAETRFLNLHAPGRGFADYLRGLRDGREVAFDQHDPPPDGGRDPADAVVAPAPADARPALLAESDEIAVAALAAGSSPLHTHQHLECVYVLDGEIVMRHAAGEERLVPGTWVQIPAGVAHAHSGPGARYLELHSPASGFGAYVRTLAAGGDADAALAASGFDQAPA